MGKSKKAKTEKQYSWQTKSWLILGVISFLAYANTLFHDFVLDDSIVITDNMYTVQGVKGWKGLLTKDTFFGFFRKEGKENLVSGGRYRPLSPMSFALEYQIFKDNPFPYHLINALLYSVLVALLFFWLRQLLLKRNGAFWIAFAAALIFSVHPLHTEVVANIKGRDEIFALLFSILAAVLALKAIDNKSASLKYLVLSGLCFFLGLMSKENTITFLAIIPSSIYFFRSSTKSDLIKSLAAPLIATVVFLIIRYSVIGSGISEPPMELMNNPFLKFTGAGYEHMTWAEKAPMILFALGKYILLFLFPHPLTHDYYPKMVEMMGFGNIGVIASLLAYILLVAAMFFFAKKKPIVSWSILFYLASLSIVSNILFAVGTNMSERFLFMPSVGLCLLTAYILYELFRSRLRIFKGLVVVFSVLLLTKTIARNNVWKDNYTLFTEDIVTSKKSAKLQNAVGGVILESIPDMKDGPEKIRLLDKAIGHLTEAKAIHPTYKSPNLLLGNAHFYKEDYKQAKQYYELALRQDKDFADAKMNMALCERELKNFDPSITLLRELQDDQRIGDRAKLQLEKSYEEAGKFYSQRAQWDQALSYFGKGLEMGGEPAKFNYFIGVTYAQTGQLESALEYLTKALEYPSEDDNRQNILRAHQQVELDLKNKK